MKFRTPGNFPHTDAIKDANKRAGQHYFSPDTLRFFKSRVLDDVFKGHYFVTSEQREYNETRRYSIRIVWDNAHIDNVSGFRAFGTSKTAKKYAAILAEIETTQVLLYTEDADGRTCEYVEDGKVCGDTDFAMLNDRILCTTHLIPACVEVYKRA